MMPSFTHGTHRLGLLAFHPHAIFQSKVVQPVLLRHMFLQGLHSLAGGSPKQEHLPICQMS
jgi:hypothetical protein